MNSEADLPEVYQRTRLAKKEDHRRLLQMLQQDCCHQAGAATRDAPVLTMALVNMVYTCSYGSSDVDDLAQGMSPYAVNHKALGKAALVEATTVDHDQMLGGYMTPSLNELRQLKPSAIDQPTQLHHVDAGLAALSVTMDLMHGVAHCLA